MRFDILSSWSETLVVEWAGCGANHFTKGNALDRKPLAIERVEPTPLLHFGVYRLVQIECKSVFCRVKPIVSRRSKWAISGVIF